MIRQFALFVCALKTLTRLPTPDLPGFQPDWTARSAVYHPVVGWLIGGAAGLVFLTTRTIFPPLVAAILSFGSAILLTGGFHEDGLADAADGLGGGDTPTRRLEIMKDSRIGSYGAMALWGVLTLKSAALAALAPERGALSLIVAGGAARSFPVLIMAALPYAGSLERAKLGGHSVSWKEAAIASFLGLGPVACFGAGGALITLGSLGALLVLVIMGSRRSLAGWTGDILGAAEQLAEAVILLCAAA